MTNNWDFYALHVDNKPASIFVDLGIHTEAPLTSHPYMAYIRLYMTEPRPDGLSSREEFDTLVAIEDTLESKLCCDEVAYIGRNTTDGCRDFYFYLSTAEKWQEKVNAVLAPFDEYEYETGIRDDKDWSVFRNFLYPSDVDRQKIENRRVCSVLEKHGDTLTIAREIDHWIYFENLESVEEFVADVISQGYQLRDRFGTDSSRNSFGVQIWRVDTPSYSNIDSVTIPLFKAAALLGGTYDGWECHVES